MKVPVLPDTQQLSGRNRIGTVATSLSCCECCLLVLSVQQVDEGTHPCWMGGPCRCSDQVVLGVGRIHCRGWLDVAATTGRYLVADGWVATTFAILQYSGCCQDLWSMANGSDRLFGVIKFANDLEHAWVEPQVFRSASTWDDQGVV